MPWVNIDGIVDFAPNVGVVVNREALEHDADYVFKRLRLAWEHMEDECLADACCGGIGPLAQYHGQLSFDEYIKIKESIQIDIATRKAKKHHTHIRRSEFNVKRPHLVLAMIDRGIPYMCATPNCGVTTDLTIDHIVPLSRGGTDELSNLKFLCRTHNSVKSDNSEA